MGIRWARSPRAASGPPRRWGRSCAWARWGAGLDAPQAARNDQARVGSLMVELTEYKQRLKIPAHDTTLERAMVFCHARTLEGRRQVDDAIAGHKKVLELAPQDAVAYARLASLSVPR